MFLDFLLIRLETKFKKTTTHKQVQCTKQNHNPSPCKLVLAQDENFSTDLCYYLGLVFRSAMLQNMLNDVVTVLILQEAVKG